MKFWKKGQPRTPTRNDVFMAGMALVMAAWTFTTNYHEYKKTQKEENTCNYPTS